MPEISSVARHKVWVAFSDLFLDTDISDYYYDVAYSCAKSGFTIDELKSILMDEVAPICGLNGFQIAGEWAGFEEDWLIDSIESYRRKSKWRKLFRYKFRLSSLILWLKIKPRIIESMSRNRDETVSD
ncbi:MAG: hypothetical protein H0W78_13125 [Planctomycetes bacterium]|nr:hypothetical protein [Planctomycetota bacterium]MBA3964550.1 hypothetical protein [Nitrospirales bacterium]